MLPVPTSVIRHVLDNGLEVVLYSNSQLPIAAICVWYKVGAHDEPAGRTGLAHLLEHMMFQGSAGVGPNEHTRHILGIGGAANGDTTLESTYFLDEFPVHYLQQVLWMEADRMATVGTALSTQRFENQRQVIIHERRQRYENRPLAGAWEHLLRLAMPEGHPYEHMPAGHMADLRSITLADAQNFWYKYYAPGNAVMSIAGDFDEAEAISWIEKYFGQIPAGRIQITRPCAPSVNMRATYFGHLRIQINHSGMMSVYRLPPGSSTDALAASSAVSVLGAARWGRLYRNLTKARCAAGVRFTELSLVRAPSLAILETSAPAGTTPEEIDRAVHQELARFAEEGPTPAELTTAVARLERSSTERLSTVEGQAVELAKGLALHGDPLHSHGIPTRVRALSPAQIREVAARYLHDAARAVLVYTGQPGRVDQATKTCP